MEVVGSIGQMQQKRRVLEEPVGLVPTMGYLHEGHLSLVRHARRENRSVVVSIFVNPSQFGPDEDFQRYPRNMERDLSFLEQEGVDVVYAPAAEEMYPPGYQTWVEVEGVTVPLEGQRRPGHFRGVATVVAKLFNAVRPARAYFGRKDAQQLAVIRRMVADLDMGLEIIPGPTVREADGLALSSRNSYLNEEERAAATVLYRALTQGQIMWRERNRSPRGLAQAAHELITAEPLACIDYVSVCDPETFKELENESPRALLALAVRIGRTRLIDNTLLGEEDI